ncbi:Choline transporter-like protein, partial [Globisporangium splendens]
MYSTPPSSARASQPSWFQSPAPRSGNSASAPRRGYYHSDEEHDITIAENGHHDDYDDRDDEREPLLSPRLGGPNSTSASVLSPSTGSSSLLRRSFRGGIRAKRSCTDIVFLVLFIMYWAGMIALGVYAFTRESNVSFAKYIKDGVDFQGHACGSGRFVYFPDFRMNPDFGFCVDACPDTADQDMVVELPLQPQPKPRDDEKGTTQELTPVTFKSYATHPWTYVCAPANVARHGRALCRRTWRGMGAFRYCDSGLSEMVCASMLTFEELLFAFVVCAMLVLGSPDHQLRHHPRLSGAVFDLSALLRLFYGFPLDVRHSRDLDVRELPAACRGVEPRVLHRRSGDAQFVAGRRRHHVLCRDPVPGARVYDVAELKKLLVVPFISYGLLILLFWWAILVTICLFGAGETSSRIATISASAPASIRVETESFRVNTTLRWFFLYHAWGVYWSSTFILSIGEMITATAVSVWYFSADDRVTSKKVLRLVDPVAYAIKSTFKYHLGTLALSAGVVAPVEYIRAFFMYLEDKNEFDSNSVTEVLAKLCCCCIWIFKSCLKFICKESFYITAIQGTSFYPSAKLATTLITSNLLRVGALNRIGHASVLLGKLIVCSATCLVAWFLLQDVSSPLLPLLAIMIFSYGVAHAFTTIYETTINMLLMCFTLDENMHGGRGNAAFAPAPLIRSVNDHLRPKWQTTL